MSPTRKLSRLQWNQNSPGLDSEADEVSRDPTQAQKVQPLTPTWANPPSQAAQGEQGRWSHGKPHQLLKKEQHYWKNVIQAVVNLSGLGLRQQKIPLTSSKQTKNSTWFFLKSA